MSAEETLKVARKVIKTQDRLIAELKAIIVGDKRMLSMKDETIGFLLKPEEPQEAPDEEEGIRIARELGVV